MLSFTDALSQLPTFVADNSADFELAYDWICEMTGISVVDDQAMFGLFMDAYRDADDCGWQDDCSAIADAVFG